MAHSPLTLEQADVGCVVRITRILDAETATTVMRLGLAEGECVMVASKIPGGPIVLRIGMMELALGRSLCTGIEVEKTSPTVAGALSS